MVWTSLELVLSVALNAILSVSAVVGLDACAWVGLILSVVAAVLSLATGQLVVFSRLPL